MSVHAVHKLAHFTPTPLQVLTSKTPTTFSSAFCADVSSVNHLSTCIYVSVHEIWSLMASNTLYYQAFFFEKLNFTSIPFCELYRAFNGISTHVPLLRLACAFLKFARTFAARTQTVWM